MNVISVDPGVERTGVYLFRDGAGSSISVERQHSAEKYDHLADLRKALLHFAQGMDMALVEDYAYGLPAGRAASAIEAGGIVRGTLAEMGIPVVVVPIPTWKALTIGHMRKRTLEEGRAYCRAVLAKYGRGFATPDEADAFLIYQAALRIWGGDVGGEPARRIRAEIAKVKERIAARTA